MKIDKRFLFSVYCAILQELSIVFLANNIYAQVIVVGYYPSWLKLTLPAEKIKFENLTHINHAFAWPNADGSISAYSDFDYPQLIDKAHAAGKKILVALGGWGQSGGFSPMAADSSTRAKFIENIINFCCDNGYDGVDIDWEFPASTADRNNLTLLVRELREAFDDFGEDWLITMAVPAGSWAGQWFDYAKLKNYVNWFGCMTYDFMGSWVSVATHNSPLYPHPNNPSGSVQMGIQYLNITRGVPKEKILLGIPFYGRGCNAVGLFKPNTGGNVEYYYSQVVPMIGNGWIYYWDDISKVPYLLKDDSTKFITFDDTISVRLKCEYSKANGLAGVMMWALGQDVMGDNQPLLETVGRSMGLVTGIYASQQENLESFLLLNNYPNPFNENTTLRFYLAKEEKIKLEIFNILGQRIAILINEKKSKGWHEVHYNSKGVPSGVYIYRLSGASFCKTGKMTVLE